MTLKSKVLKSSAMAVALVVAMWSCKEDEPGRITVQDTADLSDEAVTDAYFQDVDGLGGTAIEAPDNTQYSGGRTSGTIVIEDNRFQCAVVTIERDASSTPNSPSGVLTVDFGTSGCQDVKGNVRKGKLIFTYHGDRFTPGSTVVTTTENYFINGVQLEGVRTRTLESRTAEALRFNVVLQGGKATFQNGLFATRESDITWQWNKAVDPADDNLQIEHTSTASGTTRGGRHYEVALLQDLIYQRGCGIAVSGIKHYTIDGAKEITINYGDGSCDQAFSVTANGVTRDISLN